MYDAMKQLLEKHMPRLVSREFDKSKPTFARRTFTANGHRYASGDRFDWSRLSVSMRKAKQMFDSGHIGHHDKSVEPTPKAQPVEPLTLKATDDLDLIEDMKLLRQIADDEGAPYKVSKADQRQAIRENRKGDGA
tara:strand:- start:153 stop:557 length:405 start_codon:yes stop_codon:yes gene_type:complete